MVAKEGLVDGPGLGERGSGMYHLHRGEQRERSGTWCILNTQHTNTKVSFETKRPALWVTGKNKTWSVLTSTGNRPTSRCAIKQRKPVEPLLFPSWIRTIWLHKELLTFQTFHTPQSILLFLPTTYNGTESATNL